MAKRYAFEPSFGGREVRDGGTSKATSGRVGDGSRLWCVMRSPGLLTTFLALSRPCEGCSQCEARVTHDCLTTASILADDVLRLSA